MHCSCPERTCGVVLCLDVTLDACALAQQSKDAAARCTRRGGSEAHSLSSAGELASMARPGPDPGGGHDASVSDGVAAAAALDAQRPLQLAQVHPMIVMGREMQHELDPHDVALRQANAQHTLWVTWSFYSCQQLAAVWTDGHVEHSFRPSLTSQRLWHDVGTFWTLCHVTAGGTEPRGLRAGRCRVRFGPHDAAGP